MNDVRTYNVVLQYLQSVTVIDDTIRRLVGPKASEL
jgi:hypothetical protein